MANTTCQISVFLFIIVVISAGLWGGSFQTIGPLQAGLKINSVTKAISGDVVWTPGRYYVGLVTTFITYPTTLQTVEFSNGPNADASPLSASTSDGNPITLEVSFQFRLMIGNMLQLYRRYEDNYRSQYITVAQSVLKTTVAARYSLVDYFRERSTISQVMHSALNQALQQNYAVCEHFQLRTLTAAPTYDAQVLTSIIKQQNGFTTAVQRNSSLIRAQTVLKVQTANQTVVVINAAAAKTAQETLNRAYAKGISIHLNATTKAYSALKKALSYNSSNLLTHVFIEAIRGLPSTSQLIVGVNTGLFNLQAP